MIMDICMIITMMSHSRRDKKWSQIVDIMHTHKLEVIVAGHGYNLCSQVIVTNYVNFLTKKYRYMYMYRYKYRYRYRYSHNFSHSNEYSYVKLKKVYTGRTPATQLSSQAPP